MERLNFPSWTPNAHKEGLFYPYLSPASVRDVPHDVVPGEVEPVLGHDLVTVTIGAVGVANHLGGASGSAGVEYLPS